MEVLRRVQRSEKRFERLPFKFSSQLCSAGPRTTPWSMLRVNTCNLTTSSYDPAPSLTNAKSCRPFLCKSCLSPFQNKKSSRTQQTPNTERKAREDFCKEAEPGAMFPFRCFCISAFLLLEFLVVIRWFEFHTGGWKEKAPPQELTMNF